MELFSSKILIPTFKNVNICYTFILSTLETDMMLGHLIIIKTFLPPISNSLGKDSQKTNAGSIRIDYKYNDNFP